MKLRLLFTLLLAPTLPAAEVTTSDICIYGGTSGGVTAAVEAARHGKKVVLIESTQRLGGMSSGGLGMTDNGSTATIGGLSLEFYQRIYAFYLKPENWRFQNRADYLAWLPKIWGIDGPRMEAIKPSSSSNPAPLKPSSTTSSKKPASRSSSASAWTSSKASSKTVSESPKSSWKAAAPSKPKSSSTPATRATSWPRPA